MKYDMTRSRTHMLAIILFGVMAIFVVRLFYLQIIKHGEYVSLAQAGQQRSFVIPAERGKIYMMDGRVPVPVVLNQVIYTVIADPKVVEEAKRGEIIAHLREVAGGELLETAERRLGNTQSRYEVLTRAITRTQAEKVKERQFAGILLQRGTVVIWS